MTVTQIENVKEPVQITDAQQIIDWRLANPDAVPKNYPARWKDTDWRNDPSRGIDNGYSRLYPNTGNILMAHSSYDGEMHRWHMGNNVYLGPLAENEWNPIGWNQEPRWYENTRIVFRYKDAIYRTDEIHPPVKLIDVPNAIYTGGEGSVSDDGRYYPIMQGRYVNGSYIDIAVGVADLQAKAFDTFGMAYKPNAIDVSPCGKWFLVLDHNPSRMIIYPIKEDQTIDPARDGQTVNPGFSVGHSGWAVNATGATVIVGQNNDTDEMFQYDPNDGQYYEVANMESDLKMWDSNNNVMGFHIARGNATTKGWALISTYAKEDFNGMANRLYMLRLDGSAEIRMVCRTNNLYRGYASEAYAALSKDGQRVYFGSNAGASRNVELMTVELPQGWDGSEPVDPPGPWKKHSQYGGYDIYVETEYIGQPDYYWKWRDD